MAIEHGWRPLLSGLLIWALAVMPVLQIGYAVAMPVAAADHAKHTVERVDNSAASNAATCCCADCTSAAEHGSSCAAGGCTMSLALSAAIVAPAGALTDHWLGQPQQPLLNPAIKPEPRPPRIRLCLL